MVISNGRDLIGHFGKGVPARGSERFAGSRTFTQARSDVWLRAVGPEQGVIVYCWSRLGCGKLGLTSVAGVSGGWEGG